MSPRNTCKMCMNVPKRNSMTKIDSLPKTFSLILEEMSGKKFSKVESLDMSVCFKCIDFLKNMEHSVGPKVNKLTPAGKKRVQKLIEKKRIPAGTAIEMVLAEQKAKQMLVAAGLRKLDSEGNLVPVADDAPQSTSVDNSHQIPRMSGAQRKKVHILVEGGMDPQAARELVYAASLANNSNQMELNVNLSPSNRPNRPNRRIRQRRRLIGQASETQQNSSDNNQPKVGSYAQNSKIKAESNAPVASQKSKNDSNKKIGSASRVIDSPGLLVPLKKQQQQQNNNTARGRNSNTERRDRRVVSPRRNDRPAPYNNNNRPQNQSRSNNQNHNHNHNQNYNQNHNQNQNQSYQNGNNLIFNQNPNQNQNQNQQSYQEPLQMQNSSYEVGIIPFDYPNSMFDDMKLDALKDAITNEIMKIPNGGPLIRFLGTTSQNGWLKVICADGLSYNWLGELVLRWERVGVRMVDSNNLPMPNSAVLSFYLQQDFRSPNEILNIIEKQNDSLNAHEWRILDRESDGNGQRITVGLNENCFQALQRRDFMVFFGLGVIELKSRSSDCQRGGSSSFSQNGNSGMGMGMGMGNNNMNLMNNSNSGGNDMRGRGREDGGFGGNNNFNSDYNRSRDYGRGNESGNNYFQNRNQNMNRDDFQRGGFQSQRAW